MNIIKKLMVLPAVVALLTSFNAWAVDNDELVEARQGLMKLYSVNMDTLGEMTRRIQPYNKQTAKAAANNLLALSKLDIGALWPDGTSLADKGFEGKTLAKPDIWENRDKIKQRQEKLVTSMEKLAKDAAWSLEYLDDALKDVSDACRSCHKDFRAKRQ